MQKLVPCQSVSIDLWHVYHQCCTTWLTLLFFFNLPACFLLVFSLSLEIECARSAHLWKSDQKWKLKRWIKQRIITMGSASLSFLLSIFFATFFFVAENNLCWRAWVELVRGEKRWRWVSAPTHTLAEKTRADIHPTNFHPPIYFWPKKNTKNYSAFRWKAGRGESDWYSQ